MLSLRPHRTTCPTAFGRLALTLVCGAALISACGEDSPTTSTTNGTTLGNGNGNGLPDQDSGPPPAGDGGTTGPSVTEDSGLPSVGPGGSTGDAELDAMLGDYLLEFHSISRAQEAQLGEVTTESWSYGVLRVVAEDGALVGYERLCHAKTDQTAENGVVSTTLSDKVWPNLSPVKRSLNVDTAAGTWSSPPAVRRQGWRETAGSMPTDPATQADDFLDPDEDGRPGVATRIEGETTVFLLTATADCEYDTVSASTTSYEGTLSSEGLPESAQVSGQGEIYALTATQRGGSVPCAVGDINDSPLPVTDVDELALARVEGQWLASDDTCPSLPEFETALP